MDLTEQDKIVYNAISMMEDFVKEELENMIEENKTYLRKNGEFHPLDAYFKLSNFWLKFHNKKLLFGLESFRNQYTKEIVLKIKND